MILFATDEGINLLKTSDHWFADGTFSVIPSVFFQVYTIHDIFHGRVVPCACALLPNKTRPTYDHLFREVATHLNGHVTTDIFFDYDKAAMNSATNIFIGDQRLLFFICLRTYGNTSKTMDWPHCIRTYGNTSKTMDWPHCIRTYGNTSKTMDWPHCIRTYGNTSKTMDWHHCIKRTTILRNLCE